MSIYTFSQKDLDKVFFTPFSVVSPYNGDYLVLTNTLTECSMVVRFKPGYNAEVLRRFIDCEGFSFQEFHSMLEGDESYVGRLMNTLFRESVIE